MNFLYVRIPKTASTVICEFLKISVDHKTAYEWRKVLGSEFDSMFKFTIVRNPYKRFISLCNFTKTKPEDFKTNILFRPQVDYIYHNRVRLVDYVGKYEDLDNSWRYICKMIKEPYRPLNYGKPAPGERLRFEDVREIVNQNYKLDFEVLGYPIDFFE